MFKHDERYDRDRFHAAFPIDRMMLSPIQPEDCMLVAACDLQIRILHVFPLNKVFHQGTSDRGEHVLDNEGDAT